MTDSLNNNRELLRGQLIQRVQVACHATPHSSFLDSEAVLECLCVCVCVGCITNKLFNTAHKTLSHSAMTEQKSCRQAEGEEREREEKES